ncbi:phosphatase PAP2 family protein [Pseudonocardia kujensis]|uniref:phosphatase PAP2 family protein n=1 Tax=Pseudonocardia kujensis TaxID=1128675 RepID=UPI001E300B8D|nr:phosphatase PAP2 family protein [Pseudonocardia kujensis]MCE0766466.1 phosphatase PAP2 family protein [Pseudonocardia kujensis]
MRFADLQQGTGVLVWVCWLLTAVTLCAHRVGLRGSTGAGDAPLPGLPALGALVAPARRVLRRPAVWGTGAASALFTAQATVVDSVADHGGLAAADRPVLSWLVAHRVPDWTAVMETASRYGGTLGTLVLALVAVALLVWRRHWWEAATVTVASAGVAVLVPAFKDFYARPRPPLATQLVPQFDPSLPSGHALGSIVIVGVVAIVAARLVRRVLVRVAALGAAAATIALIGVSRLYLGVHWFTDVLAGWFLGGAWLVVCLAALHALTTGRAPVRRDGTPVLG